MINLVSLSDFDNFMNGSIKERIARGISEIAQNILDPNTEAERPRTLTVTMTIRPTKNRHSAVIRSQVTTKLANLVEMEADVSIGINEDGEMVIVQQMDMIPGQINMEGEEAPAANIITIHQSR